jgi:hypothetical protein
MTRELAASRQSSEAVNISALGLGSDIVTIHHCLFCPDTQISRDLSFHLFQMTDVRELAITKKSIAQGGVRTSERATTGFGLEEGVVDSVLRKMPLAQKSQGMKQVTSASEAHIFFTKALDLRC